jgi:hypothetical protein
MIVWPTRRTRAAMRSHCFNERVLVRANVIRNRLLADRSLTFEDIAKSEGVVPSYATRLFRLTLLAPDIVSAILGGRHTTHVFSRSQLRGPVA